MWYDDDFIRIGGLSRRRRQAARRGNPAMNVRAMSRARKKELTRRTAAWGGGILAAALLCAGAACGVLFAGRALFSRNSRFRVTKLEIDDSGSVAAYFIRERKHIAEGTNLFAFSAARLRDEFLQQAYAAKYKSIEISRVLPGTLAVKLTERVPLARVGTHGNLVADREGWVFGMRAGSRGLPAIVGYRGAGVTPGSRLRGAATAALQALAACDDPRLGIAVESIDLDEDEYLAVYLKPGATARGFKLAWKGMGQEGAEAREALYRQLRRVALTLRQKGARYTMLDATYDDRVFGVP
ncbi:MAG: hypothetical protein FJ225_06465 [Lentisphaerae bacterium]|nr:hypothetical protein [Lentisphaerota bacterium]